MRLKHYTLSDILRGLSLRGKPALDGIPVSQRPVPPDSRPYKQRDPVWEMLRITPFLYSPIKKIQSHVGDVVGDFCEDLQEFAASVEDGYLTSLARGLDRLNRNCPHNLHPDVADFLIHEFHDFHIQRGNYDLAQEAAEEAVERYRELAWSDEQYLPRLAFSLYKISERWHIMGRDDLALSRTKEWVKVYAQLAKAQRELPESPSFLPSYGRALLKYRTCLRRVGKGFGSEMISVLETAAEVYRDLVWRQDGSQQYGGDLADVLGDLNLLYSNLDQSGDVVRVEDELLHVLKVIGETNDAAELEPAPSDIPIDYDALWQRAVSVS